jgi:hypothetical protein
VKSDAVEEPDSPSDAVEDVLHGWRAAAEIQGLESYGHSSSLLYRRVNARRYSARPSQQVWVRLLRHTPTIHIFMLKPFAIQVIVSLRLQLSGQLRHPVCRRRCSQYRRTLSSS